MRKLRIAPDAMNLARGFVFRGAGSLGDRLVRAWLAGEVDFVLSGTLVDEVARTLSVLGLDDASIALAVATLCSGDAIVAIRHQTMGCRDRKDDHLLEAALAGSARWIVSEDRDVLDLPRSVRTYLRSYGVEAIKLAEFLDILDVVRAAPDDALFSFDIVDPGFSCLVCDHPDHAEVACGSVAGDGLEPEECRCEGPAENLALAG